VHGAFLATLLVAGLAPTGQRLHPRFDPPLEAALLTAGLLLVATLTLAWRLRTSSRGSRPGTSAPAADTVDLPDLKGDGDMPLPQLQPGEPLRFPAAPFGAGRDGRRRARRFGALFIRGFAEGIGWHPSGRDAGPRTFSPSKLTLPEGRQWIPPEARPKPPPSTTALPSTVATTLTEVMYLSASTSPAISSSQNGVFKSFLRSHPFSLLLGEQELAEILLEIAGRPWHRRPPSEVASEIDARVRRLEGLGPIDAYIDGVLASGVLPGHRSQADPFDPFHDGGFDDLHADFGTLARRLVQAVLFADRRITVEESHLLRELGLEPGLPSPGTPPEPDEVTKDGAAATSPGDSQ
jgi:hypothetical protein